MRRKELRGCRKLPASPIFSRYLSIFFNRFSIPFTLWLMVSSNISATNCGPIKELKNALLSTGTVISTVAYCASKALGLSVITTILAPASLAISVVTRSKEEYRGKLKTTRQSSFVMLHIWSMGLRAAVLVQVTWGRICFRYRRKKSPRQALPREAAMYLRFPATMTSAASSNASNVLVVNKVSRFWIAFLKCRLM